MKLRELAVHPESRRLPREEQLAWKLAEVAADPVSLEPEVEDMIINRIIDNAAVAPEWSRRYHATDPDRKAFGGRLEVTLASGEQIVEELAVANAHPLGRRPFGRAEYIGKFRNLAEGLLSGAEQDRFLELIQRLPELAAAELTGLTLALHAGTLVNASRDYRGIF